MWRGCGHGFQHAEPARRRLGQWGCKTDVPGRTGGRDGEGDSVRAVHGARYPDAGAVRSAPTNAPADQTYCICAYALQVVAGTNFFFKVQVAEAEWVWLRVFLSLFGDEPKLV